jgi:1,2-diacylglycerol 3-alpha-glucosyltransferase
MKILMLSDVYFPRVNGVSTSIKTFRDDLRRLGHECTLVVPQYPVSPETPDDCGMFRIPSWQVPFDPEDRLLSWFGLKKWTASLAPGSFDIIHVQTPFTAHYAGLRIAAKTGAPVIETYHTYFEHYLHHYVPFLPSAITKAAARKLTVSQCEAVGAVISPSEQMANALRAYGVRAPIHILPTGLPDSAFIQGDRARFRSKFGIDETRPVALYVGRVAHEKNIDFLIHMLVDLRLRVPDVLLVIAGEGPAEGHVRKLVSRFGLDENVQFVGYMDRATSLLDCYKAADVFVFASRTETQGLVLLEALAQETPVVSTAVMGTANVLEGMQGALIAPEDVAGFSTLVAAVLKDPVLRQSLSQYALGDAKAWSSYAMTIRLVDYYERLVVASRNMGEPT